MIESTPRPDSLVVYKGRPARVRRAFKGIEIELEGGEALQVRPKDVVLLHPGPIASLAELQPLVGEVEAAWELLAGSATQLPDLAELAFGRYTPSAAWAAYQLLSDGLYFRGTPDQVLARTAAEVERERKARALHAAEQEAWAGFLLRARAGSVIEADHRFLRDVEELALGRRDKSRALRALGRSETPEVAHALLLSLGTWDHTVDPYPSRFGLPTDLPDLQLPALPPEPRADLTHLPAFAIDDEGNQEPDDALSLDGTRLWVHVADVAALVGPGDPVDREACARGSALYLPERTVTMLPPAAIATLGLGLAEVSPALSFGLELDVAGDVSRVEILPSWVRVTRLTYQAAEDRLGTEPFPGLLALAQAHRARRLDRGALAIELPEVKIAVRDGQVVIHPLPPLRSRELVTEAMLMAGEAAARFSQEHAIPLPFTTQDPPTTDDRPTDLAGMFALRQHLRPSLQSVNAGPHAGLGLERYVQATSPLRRYLDLVVHQQLRANLRGAAMLSPAELLDRVGSTLAVTGGLRQAERLARRHWTLVYLMQHPGWHGEGVVVELRGRRATLLIPELDLDVPVPLRADLPLNSRVPVGQPRVSLAEQFIHLKVLEDPHSTVQPAGT